MPILDPLILAADVSITPASQLPPRLRQRLHAKRGDYAITRLRGRSPARLVGQSSAALLREFLDTKTVAQAILACAGRLRIAPDQLLEEAFPLLRDCFNSGFLAVAGSPEAARTLPSRERGDAIGRFEVLRCLHLVHDTELYQARDRDGTTVAIKLARPGTTAHGLLSREVAALRHLKGHGVPALVARGRYQGRPWIAMSWCTGIAPDLVFAELRHGRSDDTRARVLRLVTRIARAYARLHRAGVLHGDVHSRNLLLGRKDEIHIIDFGLGRPLPPLRLAGKNRRGGVLQFTAPEQAAIMLARDEFVSPTPASEQYALATLLYGLVTGRHPLELALDRTTLLRQIIAKPPLPFAHRGTAPWPELEAVLARALAKQPEQRFRSIGEMASALARVSVPRRVGQASAPAARATSLDRAVDAFLGRVDYAAPAFRKPGRAPTCSLMLGRTGIAYALYRLACLRDDAQTLALADAWLTRIESHAHTETAFAAPADGLNPDGLGPVSPFHAITGVHLVRVLLSVAMHDPRSATDTIEKFTAIAATPWPRTDLTLGRMGVPLACVQMLEALPTNMSAEIAAIRNTGHDVLGAVWQESDRSGPIGAAAGGEDFSIAHGWAGLLHTMLRWHAATGDRLPASVPRRLAELAARAESLGRGIHWPQLAAGPGPSILAAHQVAGWCNGPAGFVHLWTLAHVHFPRSRYDRLAAASAWSAWEAESEISDLCCGLAGRAYALLNLYRHTGEAEWLKRANLLAERAVRAFKRQRSRLHRPLSLFKGEAGIATLAADLRRPETAAFPLFEPEGFPGRIPHG